MAKETEESDRKAYVPPRVLYTEIIQGRGVTCAAATDAQCGAGPINS